MSRRSEWGKARDRLLGHFSTTKGIDQRESVPEICCGKCKSFLDRAYASDGTGFCGMLKEGSRIDIDPPVYITEGPVSLMVAFNMKSSKCKYYQPMELIDTDPTECADPAYRRAHRQMEKTLRK